MNKKKNYVPPKITVYEVSIEYSLAAASVAQVRILDEDGQIESEWERTDITADFEW